MSLKTLQRPEEEIFRKSGVCLHLMQYKMKSGSYSKMWVLLDVCHFDHVMKTCQSV